jgi:uncharacterized phage protein gp47/JayE
VQAATTDLVSITGTLYCNSAYNTSTVREAVYAALATHFNTLPVGGTVTLAKLYDVIMGVQGVNNVHLTAPTADHTATAGAVPVASPSFVAVVG